MDVTIVSGACIGSGQCTLLAPRVFTRRDDGTADVAQARPSKGQQRRAVKAAEHCPERAITIA
ncbi:ferredoxin [Williamsia maris]|uniref:Ferredoxin n=1 Tax=Williamsia maris TaxID=72806 RepID=A0ABT1HAF6_9NOCA|nr:ferredoxin [Williamsia maris]MCP2174947.1 Ferredoxin [Williamsia maris]